MDLPSCPACNQSVLDDDATHCPFCGASMSGDGTSVPVAPTPTVARDTTADGSDEELEPAVTSQQESGFDAVEAEAPQADGSETDPFAVDLLATSQAIPAAAKPTRKRPWRVHCPKCDTPGFLPRQAAGHDVKCVNPECLVPVFTAPAAASEKTTPADLAPEAETATAGKGPLITLLLVLAGGSAGVAWWFFADPEAQSNDPAIVNFGNQPPMGPVDPQPVSAADPKKNSIEQTDPAAAQAANLPKTISTASIRDQAPLVMIAAAQQRDGNRSKPFCRRLTAEYFATQGQAKAAQAELLQLTQIGADLPHLHVNVLVELWWHGQPARAPAAGPQLAEAVQRSANLASSNPFAVDVAVTLGCALIASGQDQLAESTIARLWNPTLTARLRLDQLLCQETRSFHLANPNTRPPALRGEASVDALIIDQLCRRGHSAAALSWARRGEHQFDRADRLAAWAAAIQDRPQDAATKTLDTVLADQAPSVQAVVHARLALLAAAAGNLAATTESIARANQVLEQCDEIRTVALGNLKQTFQLPIDDVSGWWMKVQAQAELMGALCLLEKTDVATQVFSDALASARSLGPAQADIALRLKAIQTTGTSGMIRQFKTVLELTGNDEARQAAQQYSRKCRDWMVLAEQRAACLDRLHRFAIAHQLGHDSWKDIRDHGLINDASLRDPFTASTLPSFLYLTFQAAGDSTATAEMNSVLPAGLPIDTTETLRQTAIAALANGKLDAVVRAVNADSNA